MIFPTSQGWLKCGSFCRSCLSFSSAYVMSVIAEQTFNRRLYIKETVVYLVGRKTIIELVLPNFSTYIVSYSFRITPVFLIGFLKKKVFLITYANILISPVFIDKICKKVLHSHMPRAHSMYRPISCQCQASHCMRQK